MSGVAVAQPRFAEPQPDAMRGVSLDEFLRRIVEVHPAFRAEKLGVQVATAERDAAAGGEDWIVRANPYLGFEEPVSNSSFSSSDARTLGVNASIERPYWKNGSRFGVDYNYSYIDQEVATIPLFGPSGQLEEFDTGLPEFHQHALMLRYTLPLRRGRGGVGDRLALDRSQFALNSARLRSLENQEDLLLRAAGRYVDWVLAVAELGIAKRRADLSEVQRANVVRRFTQGRGARVDVLRAESDVVGAAQRVSMANLQVARLESELKHLAKIPTIEGLQPVYDLYNTNRVVGLPMGDLGVRVLQLFDVEADRIAREGLSLDDAQKAQLDLDLRGGLSGGNETFGDSAALDNPDFRAGIVYRVPLGNVAANKRGEANLLRARQILAQRENLALELRTSLDSLQIQQRILAQMLDLNDLQIGLAEKQGQAEMEQYIQAKAPLTFVIQARDAVAAAEVRKAQNAATFQKVGLEIRALLDELLGR